MRTSRCWIRLVFPVPHQGMIWSREHGISLIPSWDQCLKINSDLGKNISAHWFGNWIISSRLVQFFLEGIQPQELGLSFTSYVFIYGFCIFWSHILQYRRNPDPVPSFLWRISTTLEGSDLIIVFSQELHCFLLFFLGASVITLFTLNFLWGLCKTTLDVNRYIYSLILHIYKYMKHGDSPDSL